MNKKNIKIIMNRKQYGHELALKREIKEPAIKNHSPELQSGFTFR